MGIDLLGLVQTLIVALTLGVIALVNMFIDVVNEWQLVGCFGAAVVMSYTNCINHLTTQNVPAVFNRGAVKPEGSFPFKGLQQRVKAAGAFPLGGHEKNFLCVIQI